MPASIFEKSRMSLITPSSASPEVAAVLASSRCSLSRSVCSRSSVIPITPLSGVRISWLMLARNSDFEREASTASASALLRSVMSVAIVATA